MYARIIRVLLVEDSPSDIWLLREALRLAQLPVQMRVLQDGAEASKYLHQVETQMSGDGPEIVLLDLNLPRRNGKEVLADMKRSRILQRIPVIILTSSQAEEDRRQAFALQASDFWTKPNSLPEYVEMVRGLERYWADGVELRRTA